MATDFIPDVTVVTPSFNMLKYLQRSCASVADQEGLSIEHVVVDGGSVDGSVEWLRRNPSIRHISESDRGMYDALNKGIEMAQGEVIGFLNCDEQYLPGVLTQVLDYFRKNPDVDIVFGDSLLITPDGSLVAFRKGYPLRWYYIITSHLYVLSCTIFYRRQLFAKGFAFDPRFRAVADAEFVVRVLRAGYRAGYIRCYMAAFTFTGNNLSETPLAGYEHRNLIERYPKWVRWMKLPLNLVRMSEKFARGCYFERSHLEYSIHVDNSRRRRAFTATDLSPVWPSSAERPTARAELTPQAPKAHVNPKNPSGIN